MFYCPSSLSPFVFKVPLFYKVYIIIFYLYFFVNIFYFLFIYVILTSHDKRTFDKVSCGYG